MKEATRKIKEALARVETLRERSKAKGLAPARPRPPKCARWTAGEDRELTELRRLGFSHERIAARLGRTKNAVYMRANKLGLTTIYPRSNKFVLDPAQELWLRQNYWLLTMDELAQRLGTTPGTLRATAKSMGMVKHRYPARRKRQQRRADED